LGDLMLPAPAGLPAGASLCIRPEKWRAGAPDAPGTLAGRIVETRYVGDRLEFIADTAVGRISVVEMSEADRRAGDRVSLTVAPRDVKWVQ
jgi:iron(III) transport system ATP-binding protein